MTESFFDQINTARVVMVDPPSGWMYGFPAVWDKNQFETIEEFLKAAGYPEKDIEFACRHMRMWLPQEEKNDGSE